MKDIEMAYRIAIVGRPNVGKSTLFNRIIARRHSITEKASGTTRDRVNAVVKKQGITFEIVDTGGFDMRPKGHISKLVKKQVEIAIKGANIILFVCDAKDGIMPQDEEMLPILRKSGKDIKLVVNKADNERLKEGISGFFSFGLEEIYPVSALHNIGITPLISKLAEKAGPGVDGDNFSAAIKIAIVGRPNVGKSSFINKIINEERVIVHEEPGTTRDSIDIQVTDSNENFVFIDTAGMHHKRKIKNAVDIYSLLRAKDSVKRSDICLIMIDAYDGLRRDDMRILRLVEESGKGRILIVNKWDLIKGIGIPEYEKALIRKMRYIKNIPVLFTSCKTGLNLKESFKLIGLVERNTKAKFRPEQLDEVLELIHKTRRIPIVRSGMAAKVHKIRQAGTAPPSFNIFVNKPANVTDEYIGSLKNILRQELGIEGAPIRILLRKGGQ